jgi:NAD(P)-dependent dehydrogenase (short-subunit alcohol dehydrogenase family)
VAENVKTIVITGSTRGIGYGLAEAFLGYRQNVVISGRSSSSVKNAIAKLSSVFSDKQLTGTPCCVSDISQIKSLWDSAITRFGAVDIWINNAGINQPHNSIWDVPPEEMEALVNVNLLGSMYGAKIAMEGMIQQGYGHIYNVEGNGSRGEIRPGTAVYGTTKRAMQYFTKALGKEASSEPVKVSSISPGIVVTDLLLDAYPDRKIPDQSKRIFNILGDKVETVAPYLAEQVLENDQSGKRIAWLNTPKIMYRFATASFNKRDLFPALEGEQER